MEQIYELIVIIAVFPQRSVGCFGNEIPTYAEINIGLVCLQELIFARDAIDFPILAQPGACLVVAERDILCHALRPKVQDPLIITDPGSPD